MNSLIQKGCHIGQFWKEFKPNKDVINVICFCSFVKYVKIELKYTNFAQDCTYTQLLLAALDRI